MIQIKKGFTLPISGKPQQIIGAGSAIRRVALLSCDYPGLKPTLLVQEGERVKLGQPLFSDKKNPKVLYTSPGCGVVSAINRAERRAFVSLVIALDGEKEILFPAFPRNLLDSIPPEDIEQSLLASGLWTAFRSRPFNKIPHPGTTPAAIFVTAIDSNPLAADPALIIAEQADCFTAGLAILRPLTSGKVYLCHAEGVTIPAPEGITSAAFSGPHPAGLPGTHIHFLEPVDLQHQVWHLGYQDVIAIGALFLTGRLCTERIISLAGPQVTNPRLLRVRLGADLGELTGDELAHGENRIISGSVLSGHHAVGARAFLGRYCNQVSVIAEEREKKLLDWLTPGFGKISVKPLFASVLLPTRDLPLGSATHGSSRAMVPIGAFEKVMPLDLMITWLLRSLLADDTEMAQQLGCLELDEEDLALCSYVCSGKIDYGYHLRKLLTRIEEEGA
ncbi:MAG: Na(+)-translocating NADH-quinone reductase subunit A [Desulfuromonadaceae bacterium]|nr:Na(+)-translocating NADH-quinone reductase subunit A [Desulfuromonadaceae bacterium]